MPKKEKRNTNKGKRKNNIKFNKEFAVVKYFFVGLFLLLIGNVCYFQIFKAEQTINNAYNKRQHTFSETVVRGTIYSADGKVLAQTIVDESGNEVRNYPYHEIFAHAVGYCTNGSTGVESIANFSLLRSNSSVFTKIYNFIEGNKNLGNDVITTFDSEVQKAAYEALGKNDGAVIVMDPKTGEILAMVSKPDFDPNTILTDYEQLIATGNEQESGSALFNRATQGSYTPGSVFKIFTTLEYYRQNSNFESYQYVCNGKATVGHVCIRCFEEKEHGELNLEKAFAYSCNGAFSTMGLTMDMERFRQSCEQLLFNTSLPISYPYTKSFFELNQLSTTDEIMRGSFGQHTTTVSPLHMLLITSAIANDGILMQPYVVEKVVNDAGRVISLNEGQTYGELLSQSESEFLQNCMRATVEYGTAKSLQSKDYIAYGKTGSAQVSDVNDDTHAWFVGYAEDENGKQIAIAVIVEKKGLGSTYATPIAKIIFDLYFLK